MPRNFPAAASSSADELARVLEQFLAEHPQASVIEDGRAVFDLRSARYQISAEHGRCTLQLWSEEQNVVRTVVFAEVKRSALRL